MRKALIVVDVQNDFYETGSLPVSGASQINEAINRAMRDSVYKAIVAGQDWHPSNHMSFAVNHGKEPFTPFDNKKELAPSCGPSTASREPTGRHFTPTLRPTGLTT